MLVKTGGAANPQGEAGLADLTANMLDEGTKTRTALQIAEQIGNLGASLQTSAGWDSSLVTMSTITRNLDAALGVWADVIVNPAFTEADLARVRDNLLTAISRRKDSPPTVASQVLARVLFGERHPYAWPQTGVEESLKKLGVADLRKFYETYYHPGNAAVVVAGDISEADLRKKLNTVLAGWRPRGVPKPRLPAPAPAAKDGRRIFLIDKAGAPQSSIRVGTVGIERGNRDYFPVVLMNQILGGAFYRLDMNLRERQQWTYGARSVFEMRRTPGPMAAGGEFVAEHTADAVAEILKEMRLMTTAEVTDEEIVRAKDGFVRSFPARFATRASTAAVLGELATYDLPNKFLTEYTKKIQAVTKADIQRVAAKYLPSDKMAIVVVGDRESQEAPLGHLGSVELRDLDGAPLPANGESKPGAKPSGEVGGKAKAKASARPD